jgi:hypothetical protein
MYLQPSQQRPRLRDGIWVEFVCDHCLVAVYGSDDGPVPRCPSCAIRMTPDDLSIPLDPPAKERRPPEAKAT